MEAFTVPGKGLRKTLGRGHRVGGGQEGKSHHREGKQGDREMGEERQQT